MRFFKKKIKYVMFRDHNQVTDFIRDEFYPVYNGYDGLDGADALVTWTDTTIDEAAFIAQAKKLRIKTIVMQHGRRGSCRYYPPFNFPIQADKMLVWGQADKNALIEAGHPESKIKVCGTTVFKHFEGVKREPHEGVNIVFSPEHWDRELSENEKVAKILNTAARKNKWHITTKIIEGHDPKLYKNPVMSSRMKNNHFSTIADVLKTADLVVGISESTFELIAQYLDIPVVIVDEWIPKTFGGDQRYFNYRRLISNAAKKAKYDTLEETIKQQLANPDELKKERRQVCIDEGGTDIQDPVQAICKEIRT